MERVADASTDSELGNIGERAGLSGRKADEIVFADGCNFDRVREFVAGGAGMGVGRKQLFGGFRSEMKV